MKRLICMLIFCGAVLLLQANPCQKVDSLQKILPTLPNDSNRLALIKTLLNIEQNTPKCIEYSNLLFKEAMAQKNPRYVGIALYFQLVYYYNRNELDSVNKRLIVMEPYVRKAGLWDAFFDSNRCQIELYSYREQFELAINKSIKMSEEAKKRKNVRGQIGAYQCLGTAYLGTRRMKEARAALEAAHQLLPKLNDVAVSSTVLSQLVTLSREMKDYKRLFHYLKEQENQLRKYIAVNPSMASAFDNAFLLNEVYYAYYYHDTHQSEQTLKHLQIAKKHLASNSYFMYKVLYEDAYAQYYRMCKEYDKALVYIDATIAALKYASNNDYIQQMSVKADVLTEAGRNKEALPLYQKVLQKKDSLDNALLNKQMELIQNDYQIDKLVLEKEHLRTNILLFALAFSLLVIFILLLFMFRSSRIRKALKVTEQQTREAMQIAEEANEMKSRFLSNMSYNIRTPLNGVVGFSQLIALEPDMDKETRQEFAAIIQKNTVCLMRLVNDILDLSRLEAHMMKFQLREYNVVDLANDAVYMARMHGGECLDILFQQLIEGERMILVDTNRITQALLSVLTYLDQCVVKRKIIFTLSVDVQAEKVCFCIENSPLADPDFLSQEVSIRHDINRLLFESFGGSYALIANDSTNPTIVFTYPLTISQ